MKTFINMLNDESGASAAEYALILAIVGAGIAVAAFALGGAISGAMDSAASCVSRRPRTAAFARILGAGWSPACSRFFRPPAAGAYANSQAPFADRFGASAAEYALILAIVGTAIAVAAFALGSSISNSIDQSIQQMTDCGGKC